MNTPNPAATAERIDRLYALMPVVHRMRDAGRGFPLKALLRVIAEQVNVVEDDIARLYDNWFIETADDWVVPYIGELVDCLAVPAAALAADAPVQQAARWLVSRREVAHQIRNRRAKGTLWLLEQLARDVADWPARAVEFYRLLGRSQNIDHLYLNRHRVADLRETDALDRLGGPFESLAHTVDVRRIDSHRRRGRCDIPSVGVFAWRLLSLPVTDTPACCVESAGPNCYTFSVLGQDGPLFVAPQEQTDPTEIAGELNVPAPIRRLAFETWPQRFYGADSSFSIRAEGWAGSKPGADADAPVPLAQIVPADLSGWTYQPKDGTIAVDPVLGRIAFPPDQLPRKGVRVSYRYGFPAAIGGGEYARSVVQSPRAITLYRVGEGAAFDFHRIADALAQWQEDAPSEAVIEFGTSSVYVEPIAIELADGQSLTLRAANRVRPVLRLIDWQTDLPDALSVTLGERSRIAFDGLMVTGRPVRLQGREGEGPTARPAVCGAVAEIRHCTFVPGWAIDCDCAPKRPAEASLELIGVRASVRIAHSIVGAIRITEDQVRLDPVPIAIENSIVDATAPERQAIGAPGDGIAHAALEIRNATVFGIVDVHSMPLASNSLFTGCVNVARRQIGCMRFSWVPRRCRTPRRYRCQPDLVLDALKARVTGSARLEAETAAEWLRLRPRFTAERYGMPAYAQLGEHCAQEIRRGADDGSEMGVYHDLFQPQREANLVARLEESTPAGMAVGLIFAN